MNISNHSIVSRVEIALVDNTVKPPEIEKSVYDVGNAFDHSPKIAQSPTSTYTHRFPMEPSDKVDKMIAPITYTVAYTRKACWPIAFSNPDGSRRTSEGFAERTTVTAPTIAINMPNKSSCRQYH